MTPDAENRVLQILNALRGEMSKGFSDLRRELAEVGAQSTRNSQRIDDLRCLEHTDDLREFRRELVQLKVADVAQDGKIELKFSFSSLLLQLLIGLLTMIPVGIGAYIAIQKYVAHLAEHSG